MIVVGLSTFIPFLDSTSRFFDKIPPLNFEPISLQPCFRPFKGTYCLEASVTIEFPQYVFSMEHSRTVIQRLALNLSLNNFTLDHFPVGLPCSVYLRHVQDLVPKVLVSFEFFGSKNLPAGRVHLLTMHKRRSFLDWAIRPLDQLKPHIL